MSVQIATRVFGSEILVSLIAHFRDTPGPHRSAVSALDLTRQSVNRSVRILVQAGVLIEEEDPDDRRGRICTVDPERVAMLLRELTDYLVTPE